LDSFPTIPGFGDDLNVLFLRQERSQPFAD